MNMIGLFFWNCDLLSCKGELRIYWRTSSICYSGSFSAASFSFPRLFLIFKRAISAWIMVSKGAMLGRFCPPSCPLMHHFFVSGVWPLHACAWCQCTNTMLDHEIIYTLGMRARQLERSKDCDWTIKKYYWPHWSRALVLREKLELARIVIDQGTNKTNLIGQQLCLYHQNNASRVSKVIGKYAWTNISIG